MRGRAESPGSPRSARTYHKFVNTTPNPKATKKSNGELVGPPPPPPLVGGAEVAACEGETELLGMPVVVDYMIGDWGRQSTRSTRLS